MKSLIAIVPTAGVLFLFWLAIRGMLTADRRERAAVAKLDAEAAARASAERPQSDPGPRSSP